MGIAGVSIWPLYYWEVIGWYNGRSHGFIQTDCFLYAFIVGFLWTAIPRFTGAQPPGRFIQYVVAFLIVTQAVAFELRQFVPGHVLFMLSHGIVIAVAARCFIQRRNPPPETFVLVGMILLITPMIRSDESFERKPFSRCVTLLVAQRNDRRCAFRGCKRLRYCRKLVPRSSRA